MDRLKGDQIYHKDGYRNLPTARSSLSSTTSCGQDFLDILVPVSYTAVHRKQVLIKVLNDAAINGKVDRLEGMKENVICGHLIPAGTGQRDFDKLVVYSREEYEKKIDSRRAVIDIEENIEVVE